MTYEIKIQVIEADPARMINPSGCGKEGDEFYVPPMSDEEYEETLKKVEGKCKFLTSIECNGVQLRLDSGLIPNEEKASAVPLVVNHAMLTLSQAILSGTVKHV